MLKLKSNSRKAFILAALIHAAFFLLLLLGALLGTFREKPAPFIFSLHAPPRSSPPAEEPKVLPKGRRKSVSEPPPAAPQAISYKDFIRSHGLPRKAKPGSPPRKKVDLRGLEIERIKKDLLESILEEPVTRSAAAAAATPSPAAQTYLKNLKRRIEEAWEKPAGLAGRDLAATVSFTLSAEGRISEVRILTSSGNEGFDASIRTAFTRILSPGPTPDAKSYRPTLTFRILD